MGTGQRVGVAAAILAGGYLAGRILGLVRNMALGAAFGAGPELDAYFAAFRIPDLIFQLIAGAAMSSAFVPAFAGLLASGDEDDAWTVATSVLSLVLAVSAVLAALAFVLTPWLTPLLAPGFSPEQQRLTAGLTRLMLVTTVLFSASGIITGILNARRHFLLPALAPLAYNAAIIGGALLLSGPLGVFGPAWGAVLGAALHLAIQGAGLPAQGMRWRRPNWLHPGVREVARLTGPRILGLAAMHGNFVVLTVLASGLAAGSLGALTYGWSVMMAPMGVFGMALATALFPTLAEMAAQNRRNDLRSSIAAGVRYLLFLNIPAGVGMIVLAGPLVRLLFERGQFTAEASAATAAAVAAFGTGLFAYAAIEVITRGYYALRDTVTPLWYGALALALNLGFGLLLMGPLGPAGLALGMALSTTIEFFGMYETLRRRLGGLHTAALLRSVASTAAASAAMAAAVLGWRAALGDGTTPAGLVIVVAGGIAGGAAVFLAAGLALGSPEAQQLAARLSKGRSLLKKVRA